MDLGASHISASALIAGEVGSAGRPPRLYGQVEKRGSGRGLFGTVRWKPKLLAVSEVRLPKAFDGLLRWLLIGGSPSCSKIAIEGLRWPSLEALAARRLPLDRHMDGSPFG